MIGNSFFNGTTIGVRIAFGGFVITAGAVGLGFLSLLNDYKLLSQIAFLFAVIGIGIGFIGIAWAWIKDSKRALSDGIELIKRFKWWGDH